MVYVVVVETMIHERWNGALGRAGANSRVAPTVVLSFWAIAHHSWTTPLWVIATPDGHPVGVNGC